MTTVESYIIFPCIDEAISPSQYTFGRKRRYKCEDTLHNDDTGISTKRKCGRDQTITYCIRSLSSNQYICHVKKRIAIQNVEAMIRQEYLRLQQTLYTPTYQVEFDAKGHETYREDIARMREIQKTIWETLNFNQLYSNCAKSQYQNDKITYNDNILTINQGYKIPFDQRITDCNIIEYKLEPEMGNTTTSINAIAELFIETSRSTHPPLLEEVTDAMFK